MRKRLAAIEFFRSEYNCAQSVLTAFKDVTGLNAAESRKIACGFGGGIGMTQEICGALTGAVMVIGSKYYDENNISESKKLVYEKIRGFLNEFKRLNTSTKCIELTGINFSTDEGMQKAHDENIFEIKCEKYVGEVCDLLEELLICR